MIPYGRQSISQKDIDSVVEVMHSDMITQGNVVPDFEKKLSLYCAAEYGVASNNATSSLHLSCLALGVKKGDIVWTSPITFVASANCAKYCQASVDFVDVEENSGLMSVAALKKKLLHAHQENCLPKVIIAVHFSGQSCDMEAIYSLASKYDVHIIEDASHALGALYKDKPVGGCQYSDICIFSFHPVKMITTAEGGMALTNNKTLADKMCLLRNHGVVANSEIAPWYYEQQELGFNYRMPDLLAALGISQLKQLGKFLERRQGIAKFYTENLDLNKLQLLHQHSHSKSSMHLFVVLLENSESRLKLYEYLLANGVKTQVHYIPVYKQPYYKNSVRGDWPGAELFYTRVLSIPMYVDMDQENLETVTNLINNF